MKFIGPVDFINSGDLLSIQAGGELLGLPFEVLIDPELINVKACDLNTFKGLPYLISNNSVYYLSSICLNSGISGGKGKTIQYDGHAFIDKDEYNKSLLENGLDWASIRSNDYSGFDIYLNGCETGLGPNFSGEGIMSLGLSFLYSGASQVIENYWMASDYSSDLLSKKFYIYGGFK